MTASDRPAKDNEQIAMVAHDLRTPLGAIIMQAELLIRRARRRGDDTSRERAEAILKAGRGMNTMISDLVDTARLERGQVTLERREWPLCLLIGDVLEMLPSAQRSRVKTVNADDIAPAWVDRQRLVRALCNVITNALRYSPDESPVLVRLSEARDGVVIEVEDRGVGIAPEQLPRVFEPFDRAGRTRGPGGMGLGLYISKLLVEAHGGRISVFSVAGERSTFVIEIPVHRTTM